MTRTPKIRTGAANNNNNYGLGCHCAEAVPRGGGHAPLCPPPPFGFHGIIENFLYNYNSHCFQGTGTVHSGTSNCALSRHHIGYCLIAF